MGTAASSDILACAAREIGYCRDKNGHNKYGEWYGMDYQPYCMQFVQWVYHECGADLPFKTPSCGGLLHWYRRNDPSCITDRPVPGCIVIFDFPGTAYSTDHTGLFVKSEGGCITTIDGNTSGGNDANGGYVQQRTRKLAYARPVYIVPRELTQEQEEDDMKRYNTIREISDGAPWATETVAKLVERGILKGGGLKDEQGRPADMDLSVDMLRLLVWNDRAGCYGK